MDEVPEHLQCPISLDVLLDPVAMPCCGKIFSRSSFAGVVGLRGSDEDVLCPWCREPVPAKLSLSDLPTVPNMRDAVDHFFATRAQQTPVVSAPAAHATWEATLQFVDCGQPSFRPKLAKVCVRNSRREAIWSTAFFCVVDKSGSMRGNPISQVQYALRQITSSAAQRSNMRLFLVPYDDHATVFFVDPSKPERVAHDMIDHIADRMGGTRFESAFRQVTQTVASMPDRDRVSDVVVLFLTDGQDTSQTSKTSMIKRFADDMRSVWNKRFVVHTLGFAAQHDFDFLQKLSECGNVPGMYKYADPTEDCDQLSSKISSVVQNVFENTGAANVDVEVDARVLHRFPAGCWIAVPPGRPTPNQVSIRIDGEGEVQAELQVCTAESSDNLTTMLDWFGLKMDDFASELMVLADAKGLDGLCSQLHAELLTSRMGALAHKLSVLGEPDATDAMHRLALLQQSLETVKRGQAVDRLKLADQATEGRCKTAKPLPAKKIVVSNQPAVATAAVQRSAPSRWVFVRRYDEALRRRLRDTEAAQVQKHVFTADNAQCMARICSAEGGGQAGDAARLRLMCYAGRVPVVDAFLRRLSVNQATLLDAVRTPGPHGYNALQLSVLYGRDKIYEVLKASLPASHLAAILEGGACSGNTLFATNVQYDNLRMATKLVVDKLVVVDQDMIDSAPTTRTRWLLSMSQATLSLQTAAATANLEMVRELLPTDASVLSWKIFAPAFLSKAVERDADYLAVFELLISQGRLDPDEVVHDFVSETDEVTWPLFLASERGNLRLLQLILRTLPRVESAISRQNTKGGHCLWIACCKKHLDVVTILLEHEADPNLPNQANENCLIPAIQSSSAEIVECLLQHPDSLRCDLYNPSRDNPYILCCRVGQVRILDMLLQRCSRQELLEVHAQSAQIDGFNPLVAAAELDRADCIETCFRYCADLEWRTSPENQVLPGATALAVACFYSRTNAFATLVRLGADVFATTADGSNILHVAVKKSNPEIIRKIMHMGTEVRARLLRQTDHAGHTPSHYARMLGNESMHEEFFSDRLAMLVERAILGADDDALDTMVRYGETPGMFEFADFVDRDASESVFRPVSFASLAVLCGNAKALTTLETMGVDVDRPDALGVSARFWQSFARGDTTKALSPDSPLARMLRRVADAYVASYQNKLLLGRTPERVGLTIFTADSPDIGMQMHDGYRKSCDAGTLSRLRSPDLFPMSTFVSKLAKQPAGGNCTSGIGLALWNAKVHTIRLVAAGEPVLEPMHILALSLYMSSKSVFQSVNETLCAWTENNFWSPLVATVYRAAALLPTVNVPVYRYVPVSFDPECFRIGAVLSWGAFSICSKEYGSCVAGITENKGMVFIVHGHSGRDISRFSKTEADQQVLFLPESRFVVTQFYQANVTALAQANIRHTTFRIRDKDIANAARGKCIIVELTEVADPAVPALLAE
eukprot:c15396_g1_i1.p1 GENE.c15396_g1_i1~~c15396_g1_i1.p1  ORF type:complete len:1447 (+),score=256.12 c15396_g1_i1:58-4398(+)